MQSAVETFILGAGVGLGFVVFVVLLVKPGGR